MNKSSVWFVSRVRVRLDAGTCADEAMQRMNKSIWNGVTQEYGDDAKGVTVEIVEDPTDVLVDCNKEHVAVVKDVVKTRPFLNVCRAVILNDIGGTTEVQGPLMVRVTNVWVDAEIGRRFEGRVEDEIQVARLRRLGTTGYSPNDFLKYGDPMHGKVVMAHRKYDPSLVFFGESDIREQNDAPLDVTPVGDGEPD